MADQAAGAGLRAGASQLEFTRLHELTEAGRRYGDIGDEHSSGSLKEAWHNCAAYYPRTRYDDQPSR